MMILEVRKINRNAGKWLSVLALLASAWTYENGNLVQVVCFGLLAVVLWLVADMYVGLQLKERDQKLAIGFGFGKLFKVQEEFYFHEVKGLHIVQQTDRYYAIGLTLTSGRFLILEKVATLAKAKARQLELTELFDKSLIRQKN
ncbi:hypothetical protein FVR03_16150 [Pontibacter qinzhouensis]|uniref:Uncharacterized protein n=1 Tax=Pontibacter qinzhouensis TaxID=2603253 RepID=A0A5C8JHY5_9BACT|nr:hypothetical protein [Pontibacter qinzhouensis]TXK37012.1 hypothetical protein FVR03_16150 [Pontibacter qinzhouensis]